MWKIRNITTGLFADVGAVAWSALPPEFAEVRVVSLDHPYEMVEVRDGRKVPGVFQVGDRVRINFTGEFSHRASKDLKDFQGLYGTIYAYNKENHFWRLYLDSPVDGGVDKGIMPCNLEHAT